MKLLTNRMFLRSLEPSDAEKARALASDYEIAKTTLHVPHPYPDGAAEAWIERAREATDAGKSYAFAIVRTSDLEFLGTIALALSREHNKAELGYWMGKPYWGQGYTTEAASRLVQFGFEELGLNRIYAYAFSTNPASSRVMEKIGMKYEGTLIQHVRKWDEYKDLMAYGLIRQDYEAP